MERRRRIQSWYLPEIAMCVEETFDLVKHLGDHASSFSPPRQAMAPVTSNVSSGRFPRLWRRWSTPVTWRVPWLERPVRLSHPRHSSAVRGRFSWCTAPKLRPSESDTADLDTLNVLFIPSLVRVRRPCRGLEKFFPPVLQRCYGCSFHAQEIVHTGHGMLDYYCFCFFLLERKVPAQSKLKE